MHIKPEPHIFVKAEKLEHLYSPPMDIKRERDTSPAGIKQEDIKPEPHAFPNIKHENIKPELPIIKQEYIKPEADTVLEIKREHIQPRFPNIQPEPEVRQAVPATGRRVVTERVFARVRARYVPPDPTDLAAERRRASRRRQRQAKLARRTPEELLAKEAAKREKILEKRRKGNRAAKKRRREERERQEALLQQTPTPQLVAPVHDAGTPHLFAQPHVPSGARFTSYDYSTRRGGDREYAVIWIDSDDDSDVRVIRAQPIPLLSAAPMAPSVPETIDLTMY